MPSGKDGVGGKNKKKKSLAPLAKPSVHERLLYVLYDVEHSHPNKHVGNVFDVAFKALGVETITGLKANSAVGTFEEVDDGGFSFLCDMPEGEYEGYLPHKFNHYVTKLTGKTRESVAGKPSFREKFSDAVAHVDALVAAHNCTDVVLVGYNGYSIDYPWLRTMCAKLNIEWPAKWKWGWDPYRSMFDSNVKYKVKRGAKKSMGSSNTSMGLADVYKAVCAEAGVDVAALQHHQADADVDMLSAICKDPVVWARRWMGLRTHKGRSACSFS